MKVYKLILSFYLVFYLHTLDLNGETKIMEIPEFWIIKAKNAEELNNVRAAFKSYFKKEKFYFERDNDEDSIEKIYIDRFGLFADKEGYVIQFHFLEKSLDENHFQKKFTVMISWVFYRFYEEEEKVNIKKILNKKLIDLKKDLKVEIEEKFEDE